MPIQSDTIFKIKWGDDFLRILWHLIEKLPFSLCYFLFRMRVEAAATLQLLQPLLSSHVLWSRVHATRGAFQNISTHLSFAKAGVFLVSLLHSFHWLEILQLISRVNLLYIRKDKSIPSIGGFWAALWPLLVRMVLFVGQRNPCPQLLN